MFPYHNNVGVSMDYTEIINKYFDKLKDYNPKKDTEYTFRTPLENMLSSICESAAPNISPRQEINQGEDSNNFPDFSFNDIHNLGTVGFLENKAIDINLNQHINSKQIKKYRKLNENIILTNYIHWILLKKGEISKEVFLASPDDLTNPKYKLDLDKIELLHEILKEFLSQPPLGISSKQELALQLAVRCYDIREFLNKELIKQEKEKINSSLIGIYKAFQTNVSNALTVKEFADAFAQMLGYSLFIAKLNAPIDKIITLDNAKTYIPKTFDLIRELANFIDVLDEDERYQPIKYRVQEILGMMNNLNLIEIQSGLSFLKQDTSPEKEPLFKRDPYIYFYEDFLREYDKTESSKRGVYYTPPPIVNFIVRGIQSLLINSFNIENGIADPAQVTILDFATGTGTFLAEAINQVLQPIDVNNTATKELFKKEHILKNFNGFEFLIAPYTIAHLKISQLLKDYGCELKDTEHLRIYLTNTLETFVPQHNYFLKALSSDGLAAQTVKTSPILVITGNPPYNVKSQNHGSFNDETRDAYKPQGETKLNWDDYVKFIRFAHRKMENVDRGIIGIITNNSFLNGITHRKMRQSLLNDFNEIYILNLHGNSIHGELAPDGKQDANVFDIRVGTAITFFVKREAKPKQCNVFYAECLNSNRNKKYEFLVENDMSIFHPLDYESFNIEFSKTKWHSRFEEPLSFFLPFEDGNLELIKKYGNFWGLDDIFANRNSGIQSKNDDLTIHYEIDSLKKVVQDIKDLPNEELSKKYKYEDGVWTWDHARESLSKSNYSDACIRTIDYRPFDSRCTFLNLKSSGFLARPRYETMQHMIVGKNIGLAFIRDDYSDREYLDSLVSDSIIDLHFAGGQTYFAPLYLYQISNNTINIFIPNDKSENFKEEFRKFIDDKYGKHYSPEEILGYIYAILYSAKYRKRYQELLKIDFPRIPFPDSPKEFELISHQGWDLVQKHLLNNIYENIYGVYQGAGNNLVEKIRYDVSLSRLYINETQYFENVPKVAWDFFIGGYPVLSKYLSYRMISQTPLNLKDILQISKITNVLVFTEQQIKNIDNIFNCP